MIVEKIKKLKGKVGKKEEEEFVEVETGFEEESKINVKIDTLKNYADVDRVLQFLREGNILILRIKDLRTKDINELKKSVEKLKKTVSAMDGDLVGVEEDFLVVTPKFAKIYRGKAS
ncbi:MAG: cell division protein SepF [Candidatus Aenigmatarchaeota archaeon]